MQISLFVCLAVCGVFTVLTGCAQAAPGPVAVKVESKNGTFQLVRGGKPYFVKGAGGSGPLPLLKTLGGNTIRTWGADNLDGKLAEAQRLDMTVIVGIWLGHKDSGFNYHDPAQVAAQKDAARKAILHYRDSPATLMWGIGNEMEVGQEDNAAMWDAIEDIAKMAHDLDPNHPTMTVVAEIGGGKVKQINERCPDVDIVGINSYGGGPSVGGRYKDAGGIKPYIITEFGPLGSWESPRTAWKAPKEPSSTAKADAYRATYEKSVAQQPLCLGSCAFTWGHKQEATATWFGLLLPDGSRLGATDALSQLWTGTPPPNLCPRIDGLTLQGPDTVAPGATVQAALDAKDPDGDPLDVRWVLQAEATQLGTGGSSEVVPPTYPEAITSSTPKSATLTMPRAGGGYRLFAYAADRKGGAAVANIPLFVTGTEKAAAAPAPKAVLPLTVYDEATRTDPTFAPSGYMGNTGAITLNPASTDTPHTGKTCLQVVYSAGDSWGGVVWQNPANDWGDQAGGWDLTGAKALTFWARGAKGGEVVTFQFGLLGPDKTYHDTGRGTLANVSLEKTWKRYTLDLTGQDLSRIKTGFAWTLAAPGTGVVFYLDDIRYD